MISAKVDELIKKYEKAEAEAEAAKKEKEKEKQQKSWTIFDHWSYLSYIYERDHLYDQLSRFNNVITFVVIQQHWVDGQHVK